MRCVRKFLCTARGSSAFQKSQNIFKTSCCQKAFSTASSGDGGARPEESWFEDKVLNQPENLKNIPKWVRAKENLVKRAERLASDARGDTVAPTGPVSLQEIVDELKHHAAIDVKVIDVSQRVDHMETLVICHGRSARHVYSIADSIRILTKNRYVRGPFMPDTLSIEGRDNEDWLLLDLGHIMVHVFTPESRAEINLEELWAEKDDAEAVKDNN